jgi:ribosomal protein L19E
MHTPRSNTFTQFIGFSVSETSIFNSKNPSLQVVETKNWIGDTEYRIAMFFLNIAEDALNKGREALVSPQDLVINKLASNSKVAWKYVYRFTKLGILEKVKHGLYRIDIAKLYEFLKLPVRKIAQALKNRQNKAKPGGRNQGNGSRQGFSASGLLVSSVGGGCGGGGVHFSLPLVGSGVSGGSVSCSWVGVPVFVGFYHDNVYLCRELGGGKRGCVWVGGEGLLSERVVVRLVEDGYRVSYSERSAVIAGVKLESHIHTSPKCVVEGGEVYCGVALEVQPYEDAKERILRGDGAADIARYREFYVDEVTKLFKIVAATLKHSVTQKQLLKLFKWLARFWGFEGILCI